MVITIYERSWHKSLTKIIKSLLKDKKNSALFAIPVDPQALNIPDYFNYINILWICAQFKRGWDLLPATDESVHVFYTHPQQVISDIRLIFRNAYAYNKAQSFVWLVAEKLSRKFELDLVKLSGTILQ